MNNKVGRIARLKWPKTPVTWHRNNDWYISIPFTWHLPEVKAFIERFDGRHYIVGGPAVDLMPQYLSCVAEVRHTEPTAIHHVNPQATRTTLGCPRRCKFCGVGQRLIEPGGFRELKEWEVKPMVMDNNFLASSIRHFNKVIDRLKRLPWVDFNQGLDARFMTIEKARRLAELSLPIIRLAWDKVENESDVIKAVTLLRRVGIPRANINCYVLVGFEDTPEDALYRVRTLYWGLGVRPFPMRFHPLQSIKYHYVNNAYGWTESELVRFCRYWSNISKGLTKIPYDEWGAPVANPKPNDNIIQKHLKLEQRSGSVGGVT